MNCEVCNKHKVERKDYRYIDGYFNGKTLVRKWCFDINDVSFIEKINDKNNLKFKNNLISKYHKLDDQTVLMKGLTKMPIH